MDRPTLTVADVFRRYGDSYRDHVEPALVMAHRRVITAITQCRTAALGGHVEQCDRCGHTRVWYNSCLMESARFWGVPAPSRSHTLGCRPVRRTVYSP